MSGINRIQVVSIALVLLCGAGAAGMFLGWPAFVQWRAVSISEEALRKEGTQSYQWRYAKVASALEMAPNNLVVNQNMVTLLYEQSPVLALPFELKVIELEGHDPNELLNYIRRASANGRIDLAEKALQHLKESEEGAGLKAVLGEIQIDIAKKLPAEEILSKLNGLADEQPGNQEIRILRAQYRLSLPDLSQNEMGREELLDIGRGDGELSLQTLRLLLKSKVPQVMAAEIIALVNAHLQATREDKLTANALELWIEARDQVDTVRKVRAQFDLSTNAGWRDYCRWLANNKMHRFIVDELDVETAKTRRDLFLLWADACAVQDEWLQLRDVMWEERLPLETEAIALFQYRILQELGEGEKAKLAWRNLLNVVSNDESALWTVVKYTRTLELEEQMIQALERLAENFGSMREALELLMQQAQLSRDTVRMYEMLERLYENWSSEVAVVNDYFYVGALLGIPSEEAISRMQSIVEEYPKHLAYRITLALVLLNKNQAADASELFDNLALNVDELPDRWLLIIALTKARNEHYEVAESFLGAVDITNLLPEEYVMYLEVKELLASS